MFSIFRDYLSYKNYMNCCIGRDAESVNHDVRGLVACAVWLTEPSPALKAFRPAITAMRNASAIITGSEATAIAVFTSTASAPISIASAAGRCAKACINYHRHAALLDDDFKHVAGYEAFVCAYGAASGITAADPASSEACTARGRPGM